MRPEHKKEKQRYGGDGSSDAAAGRNEGEVFMSSKNALDLEAFETQSDHQVQMHFEPALKHS